MPVIWTTLIGMNVVIEYTPLDDGVNLPLKNFMIALLLLSMTIVVARTTAGLVRHYTRKREAIFPASSILINTAEAIIYAIGFLIILQFMGISITPILTALGVGGLAVALALQDTLSNLFSGLHILISNQIGIGDYVKLNTGEEGYVDDISWRITKIKTLANNTIIVPNSKVASSIITNYHVPAEEMAILIPIGVSYGSDLEKVEAITLEVANQVLREFSDGVTGCRPLVLFHSLGHHSINFNVILQSHNFISQFRLKHTFIKEVYKRYREEGIEIPVYPVVIKED
ncbi:mechanosensitive ion channel family protein [Sporomusa carbonis]|uniref:mechanosensitive ion channel family protein n=1 Tax=Sporomusa carbonis TaxID=3076075 RepID=UPI003C7E3849